MGGRHGAGRHTGSADRQGRHERPGPHRPAERAAPRASRWRPSMASASGLQGLHHAGEPVGAMPNGSSTRLPSTCQPVSTAETSRRMAGLNCSSAKARLARPGRSRLLRAVCVVERGFGCAPFGDTAQVGDGQGGVQPAPGRIDDGSLELHQGTQVMRAWELALHQYGACLPCGRLSGLVPSSASRGCSAATAITSWCSRRACRRPVRGNINRPGPNGSGRWSSHAAARSWCPRGDGAHRPSRPVNRDRHQVLGSQLAEQLCRHGRRQVARVLGDLRRIARADHDGCDGRVAENEPDGGGTDGTP